jgi:phosphate transport system permease protein
METQSAIPKKHVTSIPAKEPIPKLYKKTRPGEALIEVVLFICGALSIVTTIGIVFVLGEESLKLFFGDEVSIVDFLTSTRWNPILGDFGIWPLLTATLVTSTIAISVSLPLGLGSAIFLSEYASPRTRQIIKPILEILAGIPTVVYGYFAVTFITPLLQDVFGSRVSFYNTASAGLAMGIMILPLIASMSEDALSAVPQSLREAAYGLGSTKLETSIKIVVPAALSSWPYLAQLAKR